MTARVLDQKDVLDHGYVALIETWGSDERIIEAARMSTGKGFLGWGPKTCSTCAASYLAGQDPMYRADPSCTKCKGTGQEPGDEKLLRYLWTHKHSTPFEMGGLVVEVQAPIFVFREWRTHRTCVQLDDMFWDDAYSEMSSRYVPLPDVNYRPTRERILEGARDFKNRQAAGVAPLVNEAVGDWLKALDAAYEGVEQTYQTGLAIGVPKEIARLVVPVGRYSRMRASANLRNWLAFLALRLDSTAQWEIRQYAQGMDDLVAKSFPRTYALFNEERLLLRRNLEGE